jgi:hypothetical protein
MVAALFLFLLVPLHAEAAKSPTKKNVRISPTPSKLAPADYLVIDGLEYPVPRNINRRPGMPSSNAARNTVGPPVEQEVYTAVDPTQ